jgi:excisionase family DNA binding protein
MKTETYLTPQQVADRWQVTTMTLRRWRKEGRIKTYSTASHKAVRFKLSEIEQFEASNITANQEQATTLDKKLRVRFAGQFMAEMMGAMTREYTHITLAKAGLASLAEMAVIGADELLTRLAK